MINELETAEQLEPGEYPSDEGIYRTAAGQFVRVLTEPDLMSDPRDGQDWYGRFEFFENRQRHDTRPDGFDGAARKIGLRDGFLWWQPPADALADPELLVSLRDGLRDLAEFGFNCVVVELLDQSTDYYGRPVVRASRSYGGIEPFSDLVPAIRDLLGDLEEVEV